MMLQMDSKWLWLLVVMGASVVGADDSNRRDILLPQKCDTVTGDGFKLQLSQFEEARNFWLQASNEASKIQSPIEQSAQDMMREGQRYTDTRPINDSANLANYGLLKNDLLKWIESRASDLMSRLERYSAEIEGLKPGSAQRVVVEILFLNTLSHLEGLSRENLPSLKWIPKKLETLQRKQGLGEKSNYQQDVRNWTQQLISKNHQLESQVRGTNNPGKEWIKNSQALRRLFDEQRFSDSIGQLIVRYFKGTFSLMSRSSVYNLFRLSQTQNDGLYYWAAKGIVPAEFPFAAQDAILRAAMI